MQRTSGYHYVTNGCNRDYPSNITEVDESEVHVVQCCDDLMDNCNPAVPGRQGALVTMYYDRAVQECSENGLHLCWRNVRLDDLCCGSHYGLDSKTMWIADDTPSHGTHMYCK